MRLKSIGSIISAFAVACFVLLIVMLAMVICYHISKLLFMAVYGGLVIYCFFIASMCITSLILRKINGE